MDHGYFDRAFGALTHEDGWWKTMVFLTVVQLVPIFGQIVVYGYLYQWARDAAWNMERGFPHYKGAFRTVLKTGSIVFVTLFCWALLFNAASSLVAVIPFLGVILEFAFAVVGIAAPIFFLIMALRAVIYDSFEPLFQPAQAWRMLRCDVKGFFRLVGISLVPLLLYIPLALVVFALLAAGWGGLGLQDVSTWIGTWTSVSSDFIPFLLVLTILISLLVLFGCTVLQAILARATGYWTAQFEPARWGASADGVPAGVGPQRASSTNGPSA